MKEYAFDIHLNAVVRVKAKTEQEARSAMHRVLDTCSPSMGFIDGYNEAADGNVRITEFSISADDGDSLLFEIDGETT